jgi:NMD protein affecting ribosome stability and mRNA decay
MNINKTPSGSHAITHDTAFLERNNDPYKSKGKLSEPTVCQQCGAVYDVGRWQWVETPANAHKDTCPACHRVHDNYLAGFVTLEGPFFDAHCEEIRRLVVHHAEHEHAEHPLKRIMVIEN